LKGGNTILTISDLESKIVKQSENKLKNNLQFLDKCMYNSLRIFADPIMREVISIHIGQAGVQMGNACWELYWQVVSRFTFVVVVVVVIVVVVVVVHFARFSKIFQ
jgi:hypothetical protein